MFRLKKRERERDPPPPKKIEDRKYASIIKQKSTNTQTDTHTQREKRTHISYIYFPLNQIISHNEKPFQEFIKT